METIEMHNNPTSSYTQNEVVEEQEEIEDGLISNQDGVDEKKRKKRFRRQNKASRPLGLQPQRQHGNNSSQQDSNNFSFHRCFGYMNLHRSHPSQQLHRPPFQHWHEHVFN